MLSIVTDRIGWSAAHHDAPMVAHRRMITELTNLLRGVAHEDDRPAFVPELPDAIEALALEGLIAHRQDLVDDQHIGIDVDGHGETQAGDHPGRVRTNLRIDELLDLGEGDDLVEPAGEL